MSDSSYRTLFHNQPDTLVQVFKLPILVESGFLFTPKRVEMLMVDFFRLESNEDFDSELLSDFIKSKPYYNPLHSYLVLHINGVLSRVIYE